MNPEQALQRLAHAGLVERDGSGWRTTAEWEKALMRAEARVVEFAETVDDPRLPIGYALVDVLGADLPEGALQAMIEVMLPLELAEEQELEPELEP